MNTNMSMNTNTNVFPDPMTNMNTNPFDEIGHIDAIVKQFKILTDNTMKLMESNDMELIKIKFLTRNTYTNKYKPLPLPVVFVNSFANDFVNGFVNVELFKFKFKFLTWNTNINKSKPLQLPVDINDVNVELLKFKFLTRNTNKSKPLQLPVDINDVNVELLKFKFKSAKTVVISPHARVIFVNDFIKNKGPHLVRTSLKLSLNASKPLENEKPGGGGAP